jgi:hypothetical protein
VTLRAIQRAPERAARAPTHSIAHSTTTCQASIGTLDVALSTSTIVSVYSVAR